MSDQSDDFMIMYTKWRLVWIVVLFTAQVCSEVSWQLNKPIAGCAKILVKIFNITI